MKASPPSHSDIQCKVKHHYLQEKSNRIGAQLLRRETADRQQISMIFRFSSNLEAPVETWRSSTSIARKVTPLPVYRPIGLLRTARVGRTDRKSVVTVKRVSVRAYHCGRRIIKKKDEPCLYSIQI